MKNIIKTLVFLLIIFLSIGKSYAEVPYEVWKTKSTSRITVSKDFDVIVIDWKAYDTDVNYNPKKWEIDTRVKTRLSGVSYSLEFRNVWVMWNEKWSVFGGYEKAKLVVNYNVEKTYHLEDTGIEHPLLGMNFYEEKEDETQYIDSLVYDLIFYWWPYWEFLYKDKEWAFHSVWKVVEGKYAYLSHIPNNPYAANNAKIPIEYKMFWKWMEILEEAPCKDSWIRFSDFNGEVMVRPDNDEDAWYWAELDIILCVNDHVMTWEDSTCVLSLADMTSFKMKPESEIILSTPPSKENKLKLVAWKILVNIKQMLKTGTMEVEMSQATSWAKWTIFELEETWTESKIKVFEWKVEFISKATWEKSLVSIWEAQTATSSWLSEKIKYSTKDEEETKKFNEINKQKKDWERMQESALKPLLSQEKIDSIRIKDPKRWEIKLDPDSIAPDWKEEKKWVSNKKDWEKQTLSEEDSSISFWKIILLIIIIFWGYFYFKKQKNLPKD